MGKPKRKSTDNKEKDAPKSESPKQIDVVATRPRVEFKNKQRVLVFSSRGCTARYRHLMNDLRTLLPHSKKDVKLDSKDRLTVINEICEMKNCNNCIYFEVRKKKDLYMWLSKAPNGPSVKFLVVNVHTMDELKMLGNALKGSRPLLVFDQHFDNQPHLQLLKEMFTHAFGTPNKYPGTKPFIDHVFNFSYLDGRIWFRNYQINWDAADKTRGDMELNEIGPRFVMQIIRIFSNSFHGETIYQNGDYVSPNQIRSQMKAEKSKMLQVRHQTQNKRKPEDITLPETDFNDVFKLNNSQ